MKIYPLPWEKNAKIQFNSIESKVLEYRAKPTVHQFPLSALHACRT